MDTNGSIPRIFRFGTANVTHDFFEGTYIICDFRKSGFTAHSHPHDEFISILGGKGTALIGKSEYRFSPGDVLFVSGGTPHALTPAGEIEYLSIMLEGGLLARLGLTASAIYSEQFTDVDISRLLIDIADEATRQKCAAELKVKADIAAITAFMQKCHCETTRARKSRKARTHAEIASDILSYISDNFQKPIPLYALAKYNGISKSFMCKIFKEETGSTILDCINRMRCTYAEYLMHTQNLSLTDISKLSGFENPAYFSKVFKSLYGTPPSKINSKK